MNMFEIIVFDGEEWSKVEVKATGYALEKNRIVFHVNYKKTYVVQNDFWISVKALES